MPRFRIYPTDTSHPPIESYSNDPSSVLGLVERTRCGEADVHRDDVYSFSVRLAPGGVWSIFQRHPVIERHIGL